MSWLERLKQGLSKSSNKISEGITGIFTKKKLDNEMLEELEEILLLADLGTEATKKILDQLTKNKFDKEITVEEVKLELAGIIEGILTKNIKEDISLNQPKVILVCGVNGNGKTTTIGKLASYYKSSDKTVMMAACDTFRAAAVEQLKVWAERSNSIFVTGHEKAEPASVAFKAMEEFKKNNIDILLIDTAGRLHNKNDLMEELAKINRVIKKIDEKAPHEVILVLDATTGQNAYSQLDKFNEIIGITGIVITKLDGTAKGGIVVALAEKYQIPLVAIGVGESIEDLRPFKADEFAKSLVGL
jgi:fused signal recognition particle receptor